MNTEDIVEPQQINPENTQEEVETTLIEPIANTYEQIQALCNQLSNQSKPFSN
ncbi:MAG: hypothetical protein UR96_C0010G0039, partial [candidate division WS6 bacterium GW2011_GWC1_36_11]